MHQIALRCSVIVFAFVLGGFIVAKWSPSPRRVEIAPVAQVGTDRARCSPAVPPADPAPVRAASIAVHDHILIARIPVLGSDGTVGREALVRTLDGGWCALVSAGPPLVFATHGAWIWIARAELDSGAVWLGRLPIDGGPIQRYAELDRLPRTLEVRDARVFADHHVIDTIDGLVLGDHAPANAVMLPALTSKFDHSPEVDPASPEVAKIPVDGSPGGDMIVRATLGGWCVLVPPGPRLQMTQVHGWVWFVRAASTAPGAKLGLYRVSAGGGPITWLAWVPAMPARLHHHRADIFGYDDARPRRLLWAERGSEDPPSDPPSCPRLAPPSYQITNDPPARRIADAPPAPKAI